MMVRALLALAVRQKIVNAVTGLALAVLLTAAMPQALLAQDQPQAPVGQDKINGAQVEAWVKLCNTDEKTKVERCIVTQELRDGNTGVLLAAATLLEEKDNKALVVSLPPGLLIEPGLRVQIDKNEPAVAKFTICFPRSCLARAEIKPEFINTMKAGSELLLFGLNQEQKSVGIKLTLSGFTKAYDGPATDAKAYADAQKQLMEQLQKKAEERRQQQGQQAPAAQAPAQ